jgi:hypothetical protein
MKSLFQPGLAEEIERRIVALQPGSIVIGHDECGSNAGALLGRIGVGFRGQASSQSPGRPTHRAINSLVLRDDEPMRRNSPTVEELVVSDERNLEIERKRLLSLIGRFVTAGSNGCTRHPRSFFDPLTPDEWATLMYKHLDHQAADVPRAATSGTPPSSLITSSSAAILSRVSSASRSTCA